MLLPVSRQPFFAGVVFLKVQLKTPTAKRKVLKQSFLGLQAWCTVQDSNLT